MAYITKLEVKKYMGVNFTEGLDSFVDTVIAACQKYIEKYCGDDLFGDRIFEANENLEGIVRRFNGSGGERLYVGDLYEADAVTIDGDDYVIDTDVYLYPLNNVDTAYEYLELAQPETRLNSSSRSISSDPYIFEMAQANVSIEGTWYYSETPPDDIKLAMMKLVGGVLKENVSDGDVKEKKSETLGDYQVTYQDVKNLAHTLKVDEILKPYKRKAPPFSSGVVKVS